MSDTFSEFLEELAADMLTEARELQHDDAEVSDHCWETAAELLTLSRLNREAEQGEELASV